MGREQPRKSKWSDAKVNDPKGGHDPKGGRDAKVNDPKQNNKIDLKSKPSKTNDAYAASSSQSSLGVHYEKSPSTSPPIPTTAPRSTRLRSGERSTSSSMTIIPLDSEAPLDVPEV